MEKKQSDREARIKKKELLSNVITNKMTIVFCALIVAVIALIRVSRSIETEAVFLEKLPILWGIFGLLLIGCIVWQVLSAKRGIDARYRSLSAPLFTGMVAAALFVLLMYARLGDALRAVICLFAAALLFFVYEIYACDFFVCSVIFVVGCVAASLVNSAAFRGMTVIVNILAVTLTAAFAVLGSLLIRKLDTHGKVAFSKKVLHRPAGMLPAAVYAMAAISLVCVLGVLLFGHLLYFISAVCAVYLVFAIIYTVKLM